MKRKVILTAAILVILIAAAYFIFFYKHDLSIQQSILMENQQKDEEIKETLYKEQNSFENPLIISDPYDAAPLSALAAFFTEEQVMIRVTVLGKTENENIVNEFKKDTVHYIPVIGLYADTMNKVVIEQIADGEAIKSNVITIDTPPLPEELQNTVTMDNKQGIIFNGLTFMSGGLFKKPYAFDEYGNIRWYLEVETDGHGYFPMDNGRFMLMSGYTMISTESRDYSVYFYDMDYLGKLYKIYRVPSGVHHEIIEKTPGGNLLVLSNTLKDHVEDLVIEIDRRSGKVVKKLDLNKVFKDVYNQAYDWAHTNSISYNAEEDAVILSVRNLSAAVKINWAKGNIEWIMSDPDIWQGTGYETYLLESQGPNKWFYEQHTVKEVKEDLDNNPDTIDLMLFDNRVLRNELIEKEINDDVGSSAVVCYSIDEKSKTVRQIKRFPNSLAFITSNYQLFLNDDLLAANHGSLRKKDSESMWGEIYEYKFSTGELLRTYRLRYGFYRAYKLDVDTILSQWTFG